MPRLELHLERIKASAAELGFAFDRHEARNRIQALCFELEAPARLRLLLARSGEITLETAPRARAARRRRRCVRAVPLPVDSGDWRLRHKTTDRGFYDAALAVAKDAGRLRSRCWCATTGWSPKAASPTCSSSGRRSC